MAAFYERPDIFLTQEAKVPDYFSLEVLWNSWKYAISCFKKISLVHDFSLWYLSLQKLLHCKKQTGCRTRIKKPPTSSKLKVHTKKQIFSSLFSLTSLDPTHPLILSQASWFSHPGRLSFILFIHFIVCSATPCFSFPPNYYMLQIQASPRCKFWRTSCMTPSFSEIIT